MIWYPDTCQCVIEFDSVVGFIRAYKKCKLHMNLNGKELFDAVVAHNSQFNKMQADADKIILQKQKEYLRIKNL